MAKARMVPAVPVTPSVELTLSHAEACEVRRLIANAKDTKHGNSVRDALNSVGITFDVATYGGRCD